MPPIGALATFGNPFALALDDRYQSQVTKARVKVAIELKQSLQPLDHVLIRRRWKGNGVLRSQRVR